MDPAENGAAQPSKMPHHEHLESEAIQTLSAVNGCGRVTTTGFSSIVRKTLGAANSERQGRIGDSEYGGSLEQKKREGYRMGAAEGRLYRGDRAILATMHGKEKVIAPIVERFLGLRMEVTTGVDTDTFGTFSRDIERIGSQLDAARAKIEAAFERTPDLHIALASEGSFGPHPYIPFCPLEREIVVLVDRRASLELVGHHATPDTNFAHVVVTDAVDGLDFAKRVGFPDHGVMVMGCRDGQPDQNLALIKDAATWHDLTSALQQVIATAGAAFVETDMRAHRNPRRMRIIKRAAIDLARRARSPCPGCGRPGYAVTERRPGLPCSWCGGPTLLTKAHVLACVGCGWQVERDVEAETADPAYCGDCNP